MLAGFGKMGCWAGRLRGGGIGEGGRRGDGTEGAEGGGEVGIVGVGVYSWESEFGPRSF